MKSLPSLLVVLALCISVAFAAPAPATDWKVGVAKRKLTPPGPVWLAGYAGRAAPSDGVDIDVFAKSLALDDTKGGRIVIVTLDLISVPRALRTYVEAEGAKKFGLKPHEILLNASHTHSAPLVPADRMRLERAFSRAASPEDVAAVDHFAEFLPRAVMEAMGESLQRTQPAKLAFSQARAGFAMNRRLPMPGGGISNNPHPAGPVDHDVPVLKVTGADGKLQALVFGYACHNTTLSGSKISGDYAGHAQAFLETAYPEAMAFFIMGCGGDQNPYPRRGMVPGRPVEQLVQDHGRALANAVSTALSSPQREIRGPLRAAFDYVSLPYDPLPQEELAKYSPAQHTPPVLQRAQALMATLAAGERPPPLQCPVQVVQFGRDLVLVGIGGEVVVDYSLRLKRELGGESAVWVAGYSNDVFGYLGSRRVIEEGGYEGGGANTRILNHPGPFSPSAEESIIGKVHALRRTLAP